MREINKIVVHCSASTFGSVPLIRAWHKERGWRDIGYHYVITNGKEYKGDEYEENVTDGFIQVGRPLQVAGAHAKGMNSKSIGICLIGTKDDFTEKQMIALYSLLEGLMVQFNLETSDIIGHYEVPSGKEQGKTCPNIDMNEVRNRLEE